MRHTAPMKRSKVERLVLDAVALLTMVAGFAADWNRAHMFKRYWPPHGKLRDAMRICVAFFLGAISP
jgi:hypothetical protein